MFFHVAFQSATLSIDEWIDSFYGVKKEKGVVESYWAFGRHVHGSKKFSDMQKAANFSSVYTARYMILNGVKTTDFYDVCRHLRNPDRVGSLPRDYTWKYKHIIFTGAVHPDLFYFFAKETTSRGCGCSTVETIEFSNCEFPRGKKSQASFVKTFVDTFPNLKKVTIDISAETLTSTPVEFYEEILLRGFSAPTTVVVQTGETTNPQQVLALAKGLDNYTKCTKFVLRTLFMVYCEKWEEAHTTLAQKMIGTARFTDITVPDFALTGIGKDDVEAIAKIRLESQRSLHRLKVEGVLEYGGGYAGLGYHLSYLGKIHPIDKLQLKCINRAGSDIIPHFAPDSALPFTICFQIQQDLDKEYDTQKIIADTKVRCQALLDIVCPPGPCTFQLKTDFGDLVTILEHK